MTTATDVRDKELETVNGFEAETYYANLKYVPDFAWLRAMKNSAWNQYQSIPYPTRKTESFRFASFKRATDSGFCMNHKPQPQAIAERPQLINDVAGSLVLINDQVISCSISGELVTKGVLFMPLTMALEKHESLVRKYLEQSHRNLGADKFYALHQALSFNGVFLYVPNGVVIEKPFITYHWVQGEQASIFPKTIVVAGASSQVSYVDYFATVDSQQRAFVSSSALVYSEKNASVSRKYIQNLNNLSTIFHTENTVAERDSSPTTVGIHLGGHYARHENALQINGENVSARLYGLTVAAGKQEFDQRTLQIHAAPHSYSDLLYKNALLEKARTIFSGMIMVNEAAQQTDAYQSNRNLQLSPDSEANSLPGLEILANDVKCSHGATTGRLDESELFYMRARGIKPLEAKRLLIFGFFEQILEKIEDEDLSESLRNLVHQRFDSITH